MPDSPIPSFRPESHAYGKQTALWDTVSIARGKQTDPRQLKRKKVEPNSPELTSPLFFSFLTSPDVWYSSSEARVYRRID